MHDKYETAPNNSRTSPDASGTFPRPEESLDRDRIASMADEGGTSAAVADLREQLEYPATAYVDEVSVSPLLAARPVQRTRWRTVVWSALALGAAGFFAALALRYRARGA